MRVKEEEEAEQYDFSDDSDYAAAAAQNRVVPGSITRSDSTKSGVSDSGGDIVLLFVKENIAIYPTHGGFERISGRLRLFKQGSSVCMSWNPYKYTRNPNDPLAINSAYFELEKDRNLYTIKALPLADVRFIRTHNPAFGMQYMIIVLSSGLAYPPLYFNGGLREFLKALKQHVFIIKSADDPNVFLVNDFQDPLQKSLASLELAGVVSVSNGLSRQGSFNTGRSDVRSEQDIDDKSDGFASSSGYSSRQKHNLNDPGRDFSMQLLEKFSLVTKFARDTTSNLFRENYGNEAPTYGRQSANHIPDHTANEKPRDEQTFEIAPVPPDPLEANKSSLIWGKQREQPLHANEWAALLDSEGRVVDSKALCRRIFYGGVEPGIRKEVWKFLLGYYEYDSTYAEREYLSSLKKTEYDVIKSQWKSITSVQAKRFTKFRERKGLIDKDVVRTDRTVPFYEGDDNRNVTILRDVLLTYSFYNFDLGYCQGMSDFLSPILYVVEDESESFWCFCSLMERLGPNFNRDQNGMHSQLLGISKLIELLDVPLHNYFKQKDCLNYFFCFRWVLIQFKREFEFEKVISLWEVLWTHYLTEHFHLYMCVAILKSHRKRIIGEQMDFDTLLKFINELSGHINLDGAIKEAEALCTLAGDEGPNCIPPGTPPSLPIETDGGMYVQEDDEVL